MLLDEPFSAVDAPLRRRLRGELRQLQREIESTMVIVTHDPDEAAVLGDEILILDEGRILQTGKTEAVFARPVSETVARGCQQTLHWHQQCGNRSHRPKAQPSRRSV